MALKSRIPEELSNLLDESPEAARLRCESHFFDRFGEDRRLVFYGAGTLGKKLLEAVSGTALKVVAFADDTPSKQGSEIRGIPVVSIKEAIEQHGADAIFVVTICSARHRFVRTRDHLLELGCLRVASFLDLAKQFSGATLPYYHFNTPHEMLADAGPITAAYEIFADPLSKESYIELVRFRLRLDYDQLPLPTGESYFPSDLQVIQGDETVFVDCGAFQGDTIKDFLSLTGTRFKKIIAYEPDPNNYEHLQDFVRRLNPDLQQRVELRQMAVGGGNGHRRFQADGTEGSCLSEGGDVEVEVVSLASALPEDHPSIIKMDIEGEEQRALEGATGLLSRDRPVLAIAAYHLPDDMWSIPLRIHSLGLGYNLHFRIEGEDGLGGIVYAIPS